MARVTQFGVAAAALAALALAGCGPKLVRTRVFENPAVRVELQKREQGGTPVARGYDEQPATISDVRIAHILASLFYEDSDQKRRAVIRSEHVYDLAEGVSKALAQSTPDDVIAGAAFPTDRRLGIFTDERVTAFHLHLEGDSMMIEFACIEEALEKDNAKVSYREWEIPSDVATTRARFTLVASESIVKRGDRGLTVAWRDDTFRRPLSLSDRAGRAKKRTVLMELPPEKEPGVTAAPKQDRPAGLSDAQIQALDEADAARASGEITEPEYQRRRRLILENKLDEAAP